MFATRKEAIAAIRTHALKQTASKGYEVNGKIYRGITRKLAECFYEDNFRPIAKSRSRTGAGMAFGSTVHRHIFHRARCAEKCCCKSVFGVATRKMRTGSSAEKCVDAFQTFLRERRWHVLDCETVVLWAETGCASAIDVVCCDDPLAPSEIYLVEVKTGYRSHRYTERTTDDTGRMRGEVGREIPNSYANQHQLQLWWCRQAFVNTYNIVPSSCSVVYLSAKGTYKCDAPAKWWSLHSRLAAQLSSFRQ